jgi:hypothetical protein
MEGTRGMHEREDKWMSHTVGKHKGNRSFWRPGRAFEEDVQMDRQKIAFQDVDCSCLFDDRVHKRTLVNTAMNIRVPQKAGISWYAERLRLGLQTQTRKGGTENREARVVTTLP